MDTVTIKSFRFNSIRSVIIIGLKSSSSKKRTKSRKLKDTVSDSNLMPINTLKSYFLG